MSDQARMSILEHLTELRDRLLKATVALAVGVVIGTFFTPRVLKLLVAPLGELTPIAIAPTESVGVYFKVSIVVGLVVAMPVIVYQLFRFVAPGLEPHERRYVLIGAPVAAISFAAGVAFATLVLIPAALPFLRGFLEGIVEQRYSINRYMSFVTTILLWAGLVFETPLVMFFLAKLGVATPKGFGRARRVVIIGAAVGAAVITPTTDPFNMLLIMGPFLLLYELGILLARLA
ncbi:MAG: twin-arginine translocase subunit TatC [Anaerolineae bacterium]|nr:twin-arginine translocase subunit TatC [Anaerolineae bacterium]